MALCEKLTRFGAYFITIFYFVFGGYFMATGEIMPGLVDESTPAAKKLSELIFKNNQLAQSMILSNWFVTALIMPVLLTAPRIMRTPALLGLAFQIMYVNTYLEHQVVFDATGEFLPPASYILHTLFATIWIAMIFLPDAQGKAKAQ